MGWIWGAMGRSWQLDHWFLGFCWGGGSLFGRLIIIGTLVSIHIPGQRLLTTLLLLKFGSSGSPVLAVQTLRVINSIELVSPEARLMFTILIPLDRYS